MDNEFALGPEEEMDMMADLITLTDEDGKEHSFELVDTVDHKGVMYVALIAGAEDPAALDGDGNLVIMRATAAEGGDEYLELIEDDDEFEEISGIFMERLSDLYDFDELDDEDIDDTADE
jgi:uncharacterized protein YrzB (UPF0473 family)